MSLLKFKRTEVENQSRLLVILRISNFVNFPKNPTENSFKEFKALLSIEFKLNHCSRCFKQTFGKVTCCRFSKTVTLKSNSSRFWEIIKVSNSRISVISFQLVWHPNFCFLNLLLGTKKGSNYSLKLWWSCGQKREKGKVSSL